MLKLKTIHLCLLYIVIYCGIFKKNFVYSLNNSCGISKRSDDSNVISGSQFIKDEYPWMAILIDKTKNSPTEKYFCGGVLISINRVLSAAHCVHPKNEDEKLASDIIISLGSHDILDVFERGKILTSLKSILIHPDWNSKNVNYGGDIAALILKKEIIFSLSIQPICLLNLNNNVNGITIAYDEINDNELKPKQFKVSIISNIDECFSNEPKLEQISSNRTFCAAPINKENKCFENSGHGFFIRNEGKFYLHGLISASIIDRFSCENLKMALFTDVTKYYDWIQDIQVENISQPLVRRQRLKQKINYDDSMCGIMSFESGLVVGGFKSTRVQFPWLAIILYNNEIHSGSGSLISNKHVITSFKSVSYLDSSEKWIAESPEKLKIFLGTVKYDDLSQSGSFKVGASKIINHPNLKYSSLLDMNQVSIITLDRELSFTEFIRPVCLWPFGDNLNDIIGLDSYVVGYGHDHTGNDSSIRKHVRLSITGIDAACEKTFPKELEFKNETKMFCAIGNVHDNRPCLNDIQLFIKIESRWYLKGLISSYPTLDKICDVKEPFLYEDIAPFVPWIQNQIV